MQKCAYRPCLYIGTRGRNKLQENLSFKNQEEYLTENGLLLGLVGKDPVVRALVAGISEKEKIGQFLNAQIKEKELEISTLPGRIKNSQGSDCDNANRSLEGVCACLKVIYNFNSPQQSQRTVRELYCAGLVKLYRRNGKGNIGTVVQTWISRFDDVSGTEKVNYIETH